MINKFIQVMVLDGLYCYMIKMGFQNMPVISSFYGIIIRMYFDDHDPPHFHAQYGEYKVIVDINRLEIIEGKFPRRALELVLDWAELHKEELLQDWLLCEEKKNPNSIEPLR